MKRVSPAANHVGVQFVFVRRYVSPVSYCHACWSKQINGHVTGNREAAQMSCLSLALRVGNDHSQIDVDLPRRDDTSRLPLEGTIGLPAVAAPLSMSAARTAAISFNPYDCSFMLLLFPFHSSSEIEKGNYNQAGFFWPGV